MIAFLLLSIFAFSTAFPVNRTLAEIDVNDDYFFDEDLTGNILFLIWL